MRFGKSCGEIQIERTLSNRASHLMNTYFAEEW
jgi:hypothetical protein